MPRYEVPVTLILTSAKVLVQASSPAEARRKVLDVRNWQGHTDGHEMEVKGRRGAVVDHDAWMKDNPFMEGATHP